MVAAVDDSGAVRASKDVGGRKRTESSQYCGLGAQSHLLTVAQQPYRKNGIRRKEGKDTGLTAGLYQLKSNTVHQALCNTNTSYSSNMKWLQVLFSPVSMLRPK